MQVAAAMLTPASLIAAATSASAPGVLSISMTRSTATCGASLLGRGLYGRSQRREVGGQVGRFHLEHRDRLGQPPESPFAEALQGDPLGERLDNGRADGRGQYDLAAVRGEADARRGVDGDADVARVSQLGTPTVESDPQAHVVASGPGAV